jgi:hypothetical protein
MTYRDDLDAAQARIASLERDLADERGKNQALVKSDSNALAGVDSTALERAAAGNEAARKWLGAPTKLELERILAGELPETAHTELVEAMRRTLGTVGATTVLPGSLAWTTNAQNNSIGPFANIYVTVRDGKTSIRADEKLGAMAGAIFGGVGGGVGGGGILVPIAAALISPVLVPITIPLWLGGIYFGCRKLFRGSATKKAVRLDTLLDDLAEIAQRHIDEAAEPVQS